MDTVTTELTAEEQAALDAQRGEAPAETEAEAEEQAETGAESPQEEAGEAEAPAEGEQPPAGDKRPQMVPHAALHEERERRKEVERQAAEDRRKWEERFNQLLQHVGQPPQQQEQKPAAQVPDVQADPIGYFMEELRQKGASIEELRQAQATIKEQQEQARLVAAVHQHTAAQEADFRAENPDYDAAIAYLRTFRDRQLVAQGVTDPIRRQTQIGNEALGFAAQAMQEGINVAERLYRLAEASGFQKPQPKEEEVQAPTEEQKLAMVAKGQQQARSLSNVRGSGPSPVTAAKLMEASPDEFLKLMETSKAARALMGA